MFNFFSFLMNRWKPQYLNRVINLPDQHGFKMCFASIFFPCHRVGFLVQRFSFAQVSQALNIPQFKPVKSVKITSFTCSTFFHFKITKYLKRVINLADQWGFKMLFSRVFFSLHRVELGESGCSFALVSQGLNIPYFRSIKFVQFLLFYMSNFFFHFWWTNDNQNIWKELSICLINMASKCVLLEFSFLIIGLDFGCKGYPSLTGFKHSPTKTCKISKKILF